MEPPESETPSEALESNDSVPGEAQAWRQLQKQLHTLEARFEDQQKRGEMERDALIEQCDYLRKLIIGILVSTFFLLSGVCLFFGKQMRVVRVQLADQRPVIMRNLSEFRNRMEPELQKFVAQLQAYAGTHPDFQPILDRYRPHLPEYFATLSPTVVPIGTDPPAP